jgi:hypothetical protein
MEKITFSKAIAISLIGVIALAAEIILYFILGVVLVFGDMSGAIEGLAMLFCIGFLVTIAVIVVTPLVSVVQMVYK